MAIVLVAIYFLIEGDHSIESAWDVLHHLINAWFPEATEVSSNPSEYKILPSTVVLAIAGIIGIFLTSVFIGIITSSIEEKVLSLRKGNSSVLEEDHTVILGFKRGEYELLNQLILAASSKTSCIVLASEMDKDEMEDLIKENLDVPNNVHIICRTVDIFDPNSLEKLALMDAKSIIISPTSDFKTTKILLAVSKLISSTDNDKVKVAAIMSSDDYRFPPTIAEKHNVTTLQTKNIIAKMIAHSCTQPGISEVFKEIFNFEGNEFYNVAIDGIEGMTFKEVMAKLEGAIPIGIGRNDLMIVNPSSNTVISKDDTILVFAEDKDSFKMNFNNKVYNYSSLEKKIENNTEANRTLIINSNKVLKTLLRELPEDINEIVLLDDSMDEVSLEKLNKIVDRINIVKCEIDLEDEETFIETVKDFNHIVILSKHDINAEQDDLNNMMMLLKLRDIRTRFNCNYNITAEMNSEANQRLVSLDDDSTDYVVASSMASLFLSQLAESPELYPVFTEILSNEGNEVYLKSAKTLNCEGIKSITEIRQICLAQGYIFIGYKKSDDKEIIFNPPIEKQLDMKFNDNIVVIGNN